MPEHTQMCRVCGKSQPLSEYHWRDKARTRLSRECKACGKIRHADRWRRLHPRVQATSEALSGLVATCIHCKESLPVESFGTRNDTGRRIGTCKACVKRRNEERKAGAGSVPRYQRYDNPDGSRTCRICGTVKSLAEFPRRGVDIETRRNECNPCHRDAQRVRYHSNPAKHRDSMRRAMYGLSEGQYSQMLLEQGGGCAICGETETSPDRRTGKLRGLFVDHCHTTGRVRGLLCMRCNMGIGQFRDNAELLAAAIEYLAKRNVA